MIKRGRNQAEQQLLVRGRCDQQEELMAAVGRALLWKLEVPALEEARWIGTVKGTMLVPKTRLWHRLSRCLFEQGDTCEECGMHRGCSDFLLQWPVKLTRQGRIDGTSPLVVGKYT